MMLVFPLTSSLTNIYCASLHSIHAMFLQAHHFTHTNISLLSPEPQSLLQKCVLALLNMPISFASPVDDYFLDCFYIVLQ